MPSSRPRLDFQVHSTFFCYSFFFLKNILLYKTYHLIRTICEVTEEQLCKNSSFFLSIPPEFNYIAFLLYSKNSS